MTRVACRASPSLALVKYWGKLPRGRNLPATPSLAVTLGGLDTVTLAEPAAGPRDSVVVDGIERDPAAYAPFFAALRRALGTGLRFSCESRNGFPGGAGLASSSSGYAALALACARVAALAEGAAGSGVGGRLAGGSAVDAAPDRPPRGGAGQEAAAPLPDWPDAGLRARLSAVAREGSASAARAVHGGFVLLPRGGRAASPLFPAAHWPGLRVVAAIVDTAEKGRSSRAAMADTVRTSPYYRDWVRDARDSLPGALAALRDRDLGRLGPYLIRSYSRMHASALAADPPLLYWLPASVALIRACAGLRDSGVQAWETMDAGPQVKVFCLEPDLDAVLGALRDAAPAASFAVARPGGPPDILDLAPGAEAPWPAARSR